MERGVDVTSTATTTQINARIDRALKANGDAALLDAGITPSEAIRALWELALRYKDAPRTLHELLFPASQEELDEAALKRAAALEHAHRGREAVDAARRAYACEASAAVLAEMDDAEVYMEALYERREARWGL